MVKHLKTLAPFLYLFLRFNFFKNDLYYVYACVSLCPHMCADAWVSLKRAPDDLDLYSQPYMNHLSGMMGRNSGPQDRAVSTLNL